MTTEERLENLERELARAKRNNRRLMIGFAVCLGMIFAWVFFVQPSRVGTAQAEGPTKTPAQREIRARRFVLEDEKGRRRAVLSADTASLYLFDETGKGSVGLSAGILPGLNVFDKNGKHRIMLCVDGDGPNLQLADENGKLRAMLVVDKDGPGLQMSDENGKPRTLLAVNKDGPGLQMSDENGATRARLSVKKGGPVLAMGDDKGKSLVKLLVNKDEPWLILLDENGKPRTVLFVDKDGSGLHLSDENGPRAGLGVFKGKAGISLFDENGATRAKLGGGKTKSPDGKVISYPESSLRLFGPDGKMIWQAP